MKIFKSTLIVISVFIFSLYLGSKTASFVWAEENNSGQQGTNESNKDNNQKDHLPPLRNLFNKQDKNKNEQGDSSPEDNLDFRHKDFILKSHSEQHNLLERENIHKGLKLEGLKLRSCEARQNAIKNRLESLNKLVTNILEVFDRIAKKVEDYYQAQLSKGATPISNYDDLVATINSKKDIVNNDLSKVREDMKSFSCTGEDPKGYFTLFRTDMKLVKEDLHAYRTSIKNLIQAIRPEVNHDKNDKENDNNQSTESVNSGGEGNN